MTVNREKLRRTVAVVFACVIVFVAAGDRAAAGASGAAGELVVLSFNVRSGQGTARAARFERAHLESLVAIVTELDPDVLLVQELDRGIRRTEGIDQFAFIEERTGLEGRFARTRERGGGTYGNAIFSRYPLLDYQQIDIPQLGGTEPRALQFATIEMPGDLQVDVLHTHIDYKLAARPLQIELVLDHAEELVTGPAILAGDFNAPDGSDEIALITSSWKDAAREVADGEPPLTYPTRDLRHRVDYVFYRGQELALLGVAYPDNRGLSDHVPILVRFRLASVD